MVKTYSRRLFSPFTSALQVADTDDARAFSLDGRHWEIQYRIASAMEAKLGQAATDPDLGFARVASVSEAGVEHLPSHPLIDTPMVDSALEQLGPCLVESRLPFEAIDHWEYWLLDELEEKPLVLLSACVDRAEVDAHPELTEWSAMPAAQLAIEDPDASETEYVPPVNDRLQKRVAARAGRYPRAVWVQRKPGDEVDFPPCLLRETWDDSGDQWAGDHKGEVTGSFDFICPAR